MRFNDSRFLRDLARFSIFFLVGGVVLVVVLTKFVIPPQEGASNSVEATLPVTATGVAMDARPASASSTPSVPEVNPSHEVDAVTPTPHATPEPEIEPTAIAAAPDEEFITYLAPGEGVGANELGRIPILMYHAFVFNEENTDQWTLTFDQFREQLDWLVANDYVMVGMSSVINRDFDVPAGKKPVVLTFDDGSGGQFRLQAAADGGYEVNPDTAVAILEEYKALYPEFAGPAFFAVLPDWCFTFPDDRDPSTCDERLQWLVDNGYEVGNHTMDHMNLTDASLDDFIYQVHGPVAWFGERITGPNDLTDVVVLPYGAYPAQDDIRAMLFNGFQVEGEFFAPTLILEVGASPARSPFHIEWTPNLSRYNTEPATFWQWAESMDSGETVVFVSDGDVTTVTIPEGWEEVLNEDLVAEDGRRIVVESTGASA